MAFTFTEEDLREAQVDETVPTTNITPTAEEVTTSGSISEPSGSFTFSEEDLGPDGELIVSPNYREHLKNKAFHKSELGRVLGGEDNIDMDTYPSWMERFGYGMQDNAKEISLKFQQDYPNGEVTPVKTREGVRLMYREDAADLKEKWKPVNPQGLSIGDVSGALPTALVGGATAIATSGASVPIQLTSIFASTFLSEMARQGGQELGGTQDQTLGEATTQSAQTGLIDTVLGSILHFGARYLPYPRADMTDVNRLKLKNVEKNLDGALNPKVSVMPHQMVDEAGSAVVKQAEQAAQLSPIIPTKQAAQSAFAHDAALSITKGLDPTAQVQKELTEQARKTVIEETDMILERQAHGTTEPTSGLDVRDTATEIKGAIEKDFILKSKKEVQEVYHKVDEAAMTELPVFNTLGLKDVAKDVRKGISGMTQEGQAINVSSSPEGRLGSILNKIDNLGDIQLDYDVLKTIRTEVNEMRGDYAWQQGFDNSQIIKVSRALTDALNNPGHVVDGKLVPFAKGESKFLKAHTLASETAKKRFRLLDNEQVRDMIMTDTPAQIVAKLQEPGMLHEDVISIIAKYAPRKIPNIRQGVQNNLLTGDAPVKALRDLKLRDKTMYDWLVGGAGTAQRLERKMVTLKGKLAKSDRGTKEHQELVDARDALTTKITKAKKTYQDNVDGLDKAANDIHAITNMQWQPLALAQSDALRALSTLTHPTETKQLLSSLGPRAKPLYRQAVIRDIIENSIRANNRGGVTVDRKLYAEAMERYKNNGVADTVLTPLDLKKLKALEDYVQMTGKSSSDIGASLVAANVMGEFRSGVANADVKRIFKARFQLLYATMMSKALTGKWGDALFIRGRKQAPKQWTSRALGVFTGSILAETSEDSLSYKDSVKEGFTNQVNDFKANWQKKREGGLVHDYQLPTLNRPERVDDMMGEGIKEALQQVEALRATGREQEAAELERNIERLLVESNQGQDMQMPGQDKDEFLGQYWDRELAGLERTAEEGNGYAEGGYVTQDQMQGMMQQMSGVQPTLQATPVIPPLQEEPVMTMMGKGIMDAGVMSAVEQYAPSLTKKQKEKAKVKAIKKGNKRRASTPPPTTGILSGF